MGLRGDLIDQLHNYDSQPLLVSLEWKTISNSVIHRRLDLSWVLMEIDYTMYQRVSLGICRPVVLRFGGVRRLFGSAPSLNGLTRKPHLNN